MEKVKVRLVYVPAVTLALPRKAESVWSCVTFTGMGLVPGKSETLPGASVAPVRFSWKKRTVTPEGGVSVTVRLTGTVAGAVAGVFSGAGVTTEDWLPHPAMNNTNTAMKRRSAAFRILTSANLG